MGIDRHGSSWLALCDLAPATSTLFVLASSVLSPYLRACCHVAPCVARDARWDHHQGNTVLREQHCLADIVSKILNFGFS